MLEYPHCGPSAHASRKFGCADWHLTACMSASVRYSGSGASGLVADDKLAIVATSHSGCGKDDTREASCFSRMSVFHAAGKGKTCCRRPLAVSITNPLRYSN